MKKAIYAGSFDPMTKGHFDVLGQARRVFDEIEVAIGCNPRKQRAFDIQHTKALIKQSLDERQWDNVTVTAFDGVLVHHAIAQKADAIVRGLRQISDFNDEFTQNGINSRLSSIPMVYFICATEFLHVSSSSAKEMARYGLDTDWLVDRHVSEALRRELAPKS